MAPQSYSVRATGLSGKLKGSKAGGPRPPRECAQSDVMVTPLARGLAVLGAFDSERIWLNNKQVALETGFPVPTVSRLLKSLVALGYLRHDQARRKYRLAAAVLGLGYAALPSGEIHRTVGAQIRDLAESTGMFVTLGTRDRLDVVVVESHLGSQAMLAVDMSPGTRMSVAGAVAGAALLAVLPEEEQGYLLGALEHRAGREWAAQRRRIAQKISQVHELGFCMSPGEWVPDISSISTPISVASRPPWVLSCIGRTSRMPRAYMERELGPRLLAVAHHLQERLAFALS